MSLALSHKNLGMTTQNTTKILQQTLHTATAFLDKIDQTPPNVPFEHNLKEGLPTSGLGFEATMALFQKNYAAAISACAGPHNFGLVVGGATPAAIAGDWLTAAYDQVSPATQVSAQQELHTLDLLKDFFGLPTEFEGSFVSGGTMSNMVNLATARQWIGLQKGIDVAKDGVAELGKLNIFSASAHSCVFKGLSMMGLGRNSLTMIQKLPKREAMDLNDLERHLQKLKGEPAIIIGNAGTVNTGDFDDFSGLTALKEQYDCWLHIDATFGGFASLSPQYQSLLNGWEQADSITIDAHKWLNVPYDSAFQFTRHLDLQQQVFQNSDAPYVEDLGAKSFINITPQGSRRWRSLPTWFTLMSYGKAGYQALIERNCRQAKMVGAFVEHHPAVELLAPVHLNQVCFKVVNHQALSTQDFLQKLNATEQVFLTPTVYHGTYAIRCSICNWRTTDRDIQQLIQLMQSIL